MIPDILVEPGAFVDLCASAIETYNKECTGFLLGRVRRGRPPQRRLRICSAHPQQTARRKPSSVEECDAAGARSREVLRALSNMRGVAFVGGYHSHPKNECELSDTDKTYARAEMREAEKVGHAMPMDAWLELIVSIRKRNYVLEYTPDRFWNIRYSRRKAICLVQTSKSVGYYLVVGGFWIWDEGGRARSQEAKIRVSR